MKEGGQTLQHSRPGRISITTWTGQSLRGAGHDCTSQVRDDAKTIVNRTDKEAQQAHNLKSARPILRDWPKIDNITSSSVATATD